MADRVQIDRRVVLGLLFLMSAMNAVVLFVPWQEIAAGKNDFPPFYASAQMIREGQASRMYDFDIENSFLRRISDVERPPNNHLPYENLIFVPLTYFRFPVAHALWTLLSVGMLAGVGLLIGDLRPGASRFGSTFLTILAFFPVWYCLLQGQDSILLLFLYSLSFWLWRRGRVDMAGFVLAMGLFRPQLVLPFVLVVFLAGKWKFVRGFIPGAVLAVGVSTFVVSLHGMAEFTRILISQGTQGSASALGKQWHIWPQLMPTWRGLLWIALPARAVGRVENSVLLLGIFAGLLWAAKRMRSAREGTSFDLAFASAVAVVALVSFHSYLHDFSLMALPLLIVGGIVASSTRVPEKYAYSIVTFGFLFFLTPIYLVLLVTGKIGLLVLPSVATLWLMSQWGTRVVPSLQCEREPTETAALRTA